MQFFINDLKLERARAYEAKRLRAKIFLHKSWVSERVCERVGLLPICLTQKQR